MKFRTALPIAGMGIIAAILLPIFGGGIGKIAGGVLLLISLIFLQRTIDRPDLNEWFVDRLKSRRFRVCFLVLLLAGSGVWLWLTARDLLSPA